MFLPVTSDLDLEIKNNILFGFVTPWNSPKEVLYDNLCDLLTKLPNRPIYSGNFGRHLKYRCNRQDYPPPPPTELYPGLFWTVPGYILENTLRYSLRAPRLYPRVYSGSSQSIPLHKPRLYPIRCRVGYTLGFSLGVPRLYLGYSPDYARYSPVRGVNLGGYTRFCPTVLHPVYWSVSRSTPSEESKSNKTSMESFLARLGWFPSDYMTSVFRWSGMS